MMNNSSKKLFYYLFVFATLSLVLVNISLTPNGRGSTSMLVAAEKKTDILFLKGKFIMKNKKGSIVISDEKKDCHCPHYYR